MPGGWRQATQAECSAIATQAGASFAVVNDDTGQESGCLRWGGPTGSGIEYMVSSAEHPCAADICYCTR